MSNQNIDGLGAELATSLSQQKISYQNGIYGDLQVVSTDFGPGTHVVMPSPTGAHYEHQRIIEEERDRAGAFQGLIDRLIDAGKQEPVKPDLLGPIKAAIEKGITEGAPRRRKITL
ncbi:hypothetical protein [Acinetobacter sp.]|uniref:hypothetical protein n=1 Tax=Acinetobacter sp. TaxID=472 RepID=UPI0037528AFF